MSPRKSDPDKQSDTIRVHKSVIDKLRIAHPRYIAKTKEVVNFTNFTDAVVSAGIKSLLLGRKVR